MDKRIVEYIQEVQNEFVGKYSKQLDEMALKLTGEFGFKGDISELKDWLKTVEGTLVLCDINGQSQLENLDSNVPTTLLIGPEGGFSEKEIELIKNVPNAKTQLLKLGNTRLRARTAALLALGKLV